MWVCTIDRRLEHAASTAAGRAWRSLSWGFMTGHHRHGTLLVEDHDDLREAEAELLRLDGYQIDEAADGEQALHAMRTRPSPCLVLLDLQMPGMSGSQFRVAQLRDRRLAAVLPPSSRFRAMAVSRSRQRRWEWPAISRSLPDLDALRALVDERAGWPL